MTEHCPRPPLPDFIRVQIHGGNARAEVSTLLSSLKLHTVCQSARCPNLGECFHSRTATFMILGNHCTRNCKFCAVDHNPHPAPPDEMEPQHLAEAAAKLNLKFAVVTSVTRDDLPDGGAAHFAAVIRTLHEQIPGIKVEVLTPDFQQKKEDIQTVLAAEPDVFNHNIETVERITPLVRFRATYRGTLTTLKIAHELAPQIPIKSGIMVGLGENDDEVVQTLQDLREVGVSLLTIGQYLPPTAHSYPLDRYVTPAQYASFKERALALGFSGVAAGPLVRSSYHAAELHKES